MKNISMCRFVVTALAVTLCIALLLGLAEPANAASDTLEASSPILFANPFSQLVGNRARMIQLSVVAVTIGCGLLWWRR